MTEAIYASSRGNGGLFLVGMIVWMGGCLAILMWMARTQKEFIRLYREVLGVDLIPPPERYEREPWRVLAEGLPTSFHGLRAMFRRQSNPDLERARRLAVYTYIGLIVWGLGTMPLPLILESMGR